VTHTSKLDYIIVGQGIAGTCIAYQLIKKGFKVLVVDGGHAKSASAVAAGLYNPIVFKRFTESWMAHELINYLDSFYAEIETLLKVKIHRKLNIVKILSNQAEVDLWKKKSLNTNFMFENISTDYFSSSVKKNEGLGFVEHSGAVDVLTFISEFRKYLTSTNSLLEDVFDYDEISNQENKITYKGLDAKAIVFCEGANAMFNPYFPQKAFKLTHGELIDIEANNLPTNEVLNKGVFVLPFGGNNYHVGSTYEWELVDGNTSEKGLNELVSKLENVLSVSYKIAKHKAGIRPTVADRRPLIGKNINHSNLYFFNGMGTKGVMLAPYFSEIFVNHLLSNTPFDSEIDIARYF